MAERRRRTRAHSRPGPEHTMAGPRRSTDEDFRKWRRRVERAVTLRRDWERRYLVETCERFYLGNQHEVGDAHPWFDTQEHRVTFNYIWATIQSQLPALLYTNPGFNVRPRRPASNAVQEHVAAMQKALLENIAQQDRHLKSAGRLAVVQSYFRVGVLKVCYEPRLEPNPRAGAPMYVTAADGQLAHDADGFPMALLGDDGQPAREPARVLTDELYRWRWVDAARMLFPDQGPDRHRWTWIGEEVVVPLEVARDDERFPQRLRDQLVSNAGPDTRGRAEAQAAYGSEGDLPELDECVHYYECWDIWRKKLCVWADGQPFGDEWLVYDDVPAWVEDHPYCLSESTSFVIGPTPSPWPVPMVFQWLSLQREYNTRRQQITQGAGRSARKMLYEESTFMDEDDAIRLLQSSDDLAAAKVTNLEKPPLYLVDPPLPADILRDIPLLQADWRAIAGITASRQQNVEPGQSPTEAGYAEQFASARDLLARDGITDMMIQAGTKMLQCLKATMTLGRLVKIRQLTEQELHSLLVQVYGPDQAQALSQVPGFAQNVQQRFGQEKWMEVTREQLTFESDVDIVPGSMRARTTDTERQQLLAFLQILGQAPQIALSRELLKQVARAFEIDSEPLLDEVNALARQMVSINANQAGRNQGGDNAQSQSSTNTPAQNGGATPPVAGRLGAALLGGR